MALGLYTVTTRGTGKPRSLKSPVYMRVNVATAGKMYAELTGKPEEECTAAFLSKELNAANLLHALIFKYNALEATALGTEEDK